MRTYFIGVSVPILVGIILLMCAGCDSCRGSSGDESSEVSHIAQARDARVISPDAGDETDTGTLRPADGGVPRGSPMLIAQRFVAGWANGEIEPLREICDGEVRDLVDRAISGESVDTPLGSYVPGGRGTRSISFSERRANVDSGIHRIEFTLTPRDAEPIQQLVLVRESDGKIVGWSVLSP